MTCALPWPLPVFCHRSKTTLYRPRCGNTAREFRSMAEATDYETGVRCRQAGTGLLDEASSATRQGWLDEDSHQANPPTWRQQP